MARTNNLTNFLTDVSAAIKQKIGDNTPIPASDFDTEILSIETVGNYQDKTLSITTNGNYRLEPDQNFDAMSSVSITVSVPTGEDLDAVITAQEQKLTQLETILQSKASGGGNDLNIFLQDTEPTKKQGIWLKVSNKEYEKVVASDSVVEEPTWLPDGSVRNIPYSFYDGAATSIGTDIYLFGGSGNNTTAYKYNTITDTYTQLTNIPYSFYEGSVVAVGTDIYLLGSSVNGYNNYKYDTINDTYTQLSNIPFEFYLGGVTVIGTDIYILGSYFSEQAYKYDTLTDTYTQLRSIPNNFGKGAVAVIGTDIYLLGGNFSKQKNYKYDTLTDTYTRLTDIPYEFIDGSATSIGGDIYLFGGYNVETTNYKYNISTDTYTRLTDIPYEFSIGSTVTIYNNVYLLGGYQNRTKVQVLQFPSSEFDDKTIVLLNGNTYKTQLYSNDLVDNSVKYPFSDAWYYTEQGGLETDIPTYYGDGTNWVNIKNPINDGGGE